MANEIYGSNAITGSIEDTKEQTITITNNGQQEEVNVKDTVKGGETEDKNEAQKDVEETSSDTQSDNEEEIVKELEADVKKHDKVVSDAEAKLSEKGLDFKAIKAEYDKNLTLSDETYKALEGAGYTKDAVDMMLEGIRAVATKFESAVVEHVGGKKSFKGIQEFVKAEGQKSVDIFNKVMGCKDYEQVAMFLDGIKARMTLKHGTNTAITLGTKTTPKIQGFASKGEMVEAMSNPKYRTDSAYRTEVQRKVIYSNFM